MKNLITLSLGAFLLFNPLNARAEENRDLEDKAIEGVLKNMVSGYRQMIHERTQSIRTMQSSDFAAMMKSDKDRKLFLEIAENANMQKFAPAILKGDTYYIDLPFGHKAHYSVTDVAQGVIFINDRPFKVPQVSSYVEFVEAMRNFLNSSKRTSWMDFFITPAYAFFTASIQDIIIAHTSGYISINYDDADIIHNEKHYASLFYETLNKEIIKAKSECTRSQTDVGQSRANYLSDSVKKVIDSLKYEDTNYSEYLIISGLMRKYAGRLTTSKEATIGKSYNLTAEIVKSASAESRYKSFFKDRCELLVEAMLPSAYLPDTRRTFEGYQQNLCRGINELKSCYRQLDELHAGAVQGRRNDLNKVFEKGSLEAQQEVKGVSR